MQREVFSQSEFTSLTLDFDPESVWCWPTVFDAGPTSNRLWVYFSCCLGSCNFSLNVYPPNTRHWPNVVGRRLQRRTNIKTTLVQCPVFAGYVPCGMQCVHVTCMSTLHAALTAHCYRCYALRWGHHLATPGSGSHGNYLPLGYLNRLLLHKWSCELFQRLSFFGVIISR